MFSAIPIWGWILMVVIVILAGWYLAVDDRDYENGKDRLLGLILFVLGVNSASMLILFLVVQFLIFIGVVE
tara:strand:- start:388 stop:600 length:213 start_codon:yes stop_codon:yes gene_type:complete